MTSLRIIIVNYNVRHFLAKCLDSIMSSDLGAYKIEVYVVDNNSVDGSQSFIKENYPWVTFIENKENVGFAVANNQALEEASTDYVLLLNPDTILAKDTLRKSIESLELDSKIGALGVKMVDGRGEFLPESKRAIPTAWNSFCKLSGLSSLFPKSRWFSGYNLGYLAENENNNVDVLCGAYMMMPTKVIEEVGALDERFFMYAEDIDLSKRIKEAGYKVFYLSDTQIIHYKGESTKKASANYVKVFYGAMYQYVEKHYSEGGQYFRTFLKLGIIVRAFISLLKRWILPWVFPIIDTVIMFVFLSLFKDWWASFYFENPNYYENSYINYNLIMYSILWVLSLKFVGWYKKLVGAIGAVGGIFLGTLIILSLYALIPEMYRSSRTIILIGSGISLTTVLVTRWLAHRLKIIKTINEKDKRVLLVTSKANIDKFSENYKSNKVLGTINPISGESDSFYLNNLDNLKFVCRDLKVDEIAFNIDDLAMEKAIKIMEELPSDISFKIGGGSHIGLIGSKTNNSDLYSLEVKYNIQNMVGIRSKRIVDILFSLGFFVLSPLRLLFKQKIDFVKDGFHLLIGSKTLIGYAGELSDYEYLPKIKSGVFHLRKGLNSEVTIRDVNFNYAKNYSALMDLRIIKYILVNS